MSKFLSGIALLSLLCASRTPQDKKERGKTAELTKRYRELMNSNGKQLKGISEDIEKGRPEADIKKRLASIQETAAKARDLKYRKDEEEQEKLDAQFDIFLLKLKNDFEGVEWGDKENRLYLAERLQAKCDVCHELLRD
jgi:hypothetical protein